MSQAILRDLKEFRQYISILLRKSKLYFDFLKNIYLFRLWDDLVMIDAYPADDSILSLAHS
jgi:hypothetical protein